MQQHAVLCFVGWVMCPTKMVHCELKIEDGILCDSHTNESKLMGHSGES